MRPIAGGEVESASADGEAIAGIANGPYVRAQCLGLFVLGGVLTNGRDPSNSVAKKIKVNGTRGTYQIEFPDAVRTPHQTRAKAITGRGTAGASRVSPK